MNSIKPSHDTVAETLSDLTSASEFKGLLHTSHMCDTAFMETVASRELRNQTRELLDRVAEGESVCITVHGKPVAELRPIEERPQWISRERFIRDVLAHQADHGMADDLADLKSETTDDLPWP